MTVATVDTDTLLTTRQVADALGVKVETVQRYCLNAEQDRTPALEAMRFGRSFMVTQAELNRFVKERRPPGRQKA